jgi:hypothetical protein
MGSKKEIEAIVRSLRAFDGDAVELTKSNHYRIKCPDGSLYFTGSTPSDYRVLRKVKNELVKRGFPNDVVGLIPDDAVYGFVPPPIPANEWDQLNEDLGHTPRLAPELEDEIAKKGSLIRLVPNPEWKDPGQYKGTPPFVVHRWWKVFGQAIQLGDTEAHNIYIEALVGGEIKFVLAAEWFFNVEVINKQDGKLL